MGDLLRPTDGAPHARVLLGVMSNPTNDRLRRQLRSWNGQFASLGKGVDVRFVFGKSFYPSTALDAATLGEDAFVVEGRECLPHVGVVTEKSGWWWRTVAARQPGYDYYCKSDDDTLVHLDRLQSALSRIEHSLPRAKTYTGHMKWRGWDDQTDALSACGGNWGGAHKTLEDLITHTKSPDGKILPPCSHAAGPYPYMSGGMVCMSRPLAQLLGEDREFGRFLSLAWERNDHGSRCRTRAECATQPEATRMWHHEDAGIAYNVFRAVVRANTSAALIPVTGHFDDASAIERTAVRSDGGNLTALDAFMSARALFAHNIKHGLDFARAQARWQLSRRARPEFTPHLHSLAGRPPERFGAHRRPRAVRAQVRTRFCYGSTAAAEA